MWIVHCDGCNKSGMFDISFKFILESHLCEKCRHHTAEEWDYNFCNIACLMDWLRKNKIEEEGFPCRACHNMEGKPTGFAWGFEANGVCKTCNGDKRVKGHRLQEWEHRLIAPN
jgi:hypothetical protein